MHEIKRPIFSKFLDGPCQISQTILEKNFSHYLASQVFLEILGQEIFGNYSLYLRILGRGVFLRKIAYF